MAAHTEHLAQEVLREREPVTADVVARRQQPAAHPLLERMRAIARGGLREHADETRRVPAEHPAQRVSASELVPERLGRDAQGVSGNR